MQMCGRFRTFGRVGKRELFGNFITSHRAIIAAWCNASGLELNIKCTDWPNATKTKEKRTKIEGT